MLAAATTSLFGKSSSLSAYTIHTTPTSTPSSSTLNLSSTPGQASRRKPLSVGLWKVLSGTHKTTGKDVSVWIFEKRTIDGVRGPQLKETVFETLRKEVRAGNSRSAIRRELTLVICIRTGTIFNQTTTPGSTANHRTTRRDPVRAHIRHRSHHWQP